jgi:hypothetical protein
MGDISRFAQTKRQKPRAYQQIQITEISVLIHVVKLIIYYYIACFTKFIFHRFPAVNFDIKLL